MANDVSINSRKLSLALPQLVDYTFGDAKWLVETEILVVTLPVLGSID